MKTVCMVHKYSINGVNIVLDINSGAIHVVDEVTYDVLNFYPNDTDLIINALEDKYDKFVVTEALSEIHELINSGLLYSEFSYDDVLLGFEKRSPVVKALCLHVSHDCNLSCGYCFAGEGQYNGKRSLMSFDVGKAAIDFIIDNSGTRRNLEIDFFGGEPLMNFDVIRKIVDYARQREFECDKHFRFTLTTNGILLDDDKQQYINENMDNVVLSIDGRKSVNDNMRKRFNGGSCYDAIVPRFLNMAASRNYSNYYVRGTFTSKNLDFSNDVIHLADLGFNQISVEPVVSDYGQDYSLCDDDLPVLFEQYELLAGEVIKRTMEDKAFNFFHFMIDLTGGPCVFKRISGCGAGCEYLAVTPEGDFFPCHQFVGLDEFYMGNIKDGIVNLDKKAQFEDCNVLKKEACSLCWAKYYCSGGCAANSYSFNNDILKPYELGCALAKKRIECAIYIKVVLSGIS